MPRVPQVTGPSVAQQAAPDAYQQTPRALGVAGEIRSRQIGQAADLTAQFVEQADEARVTDALTQAANVDTELSFGEGGFTKLQGAAALQRESGRPLADEYVGRLQERVRAIGDGLTGRQRRAFQARTADLAVSMYRRASAHEVEQQRVYEAGVLDATVQSGQQRMGLGWSDPELVAQSAASIRETIARAGQRAGWSPEQTQAATVKALSPGYAAVLSSAIEARNFDLAESYLKEVAPALQPQARLQIERAINDGREDVAFEGALQLIDEDAKGFLERAGQRSAKGQRGQQTGEVAEDAAERVAADPLLSKLSPQRLRQAVDRASMIVAQQEARAAAEAERRARLAEAAAAKKEREATQAFTILQSRAMQGVATDPAADRKLFDAIQGTPYAAEYQRLAGEIPKRTAVAMLPLTQQQAQLDGLLAQRNANGTSTALEDEIKRRQGILDAARKQFDEDPIRAGQQYGLIRAPAPLDVRTLDTVRAGLAGRAQQAADLRPHVGRAVSPLTPDEASRVAQLLAALPVEQRGEQIAALAGAMPGDQAQALARQLDGKDRALALSLAAGSTRTTQGRAVAELIQRGAQAVKDKAVKEEGGAEYGLRARLAEALGDAVGGRARDDVLDTARLIFLGKQAEGSGISIEGAIGMAVGGKVVQHNGRRLPVPTGAEDVAGRLAQYPAAKVAQQAKDGNVYLPGGQTLPVAQFVAALPGAQLEPAGFGRYFVRSGGSLAMNAERRPIVVDLR